MKILRLYTVIEETHEEGGKELARPLKRVAAAAVIRNPFAGQYVEDLTPLFELGEQLGALLGERAVAALGGDAVGWKNLV